MKQFIIRLVKGISLAAGVALVICGFLWSTHSVHRVFWGAVILAIVIFTFRYLIREDWEEYRDKGGKCRMRKLSKIEQIVVTVWIYLSIAICGIMLWLIGYGAGMLFHLHSEYWEVYFVYGVVYSFAAVLLFFLLTAGADYIYRTLTQNEKRQVALHLAGELFKWLIICACSIAVAEAIFYFLLPLTAT